MTKTQELAARGAEVVMNTYSRFPIAFDHGEGVYIWDMDGKKYLDFVAGIAVNSLGYSHKKLCEKIADQCQKLIHVSNLYYTEPQIELAEMLCKNSCFDKVFFCNSGAESIESMLKLARKYADMKNKPGRDIITMEKSFHGRTYGAVTATGQDKYHKGLFPMLPGIKHVPFNDFEALLNTVDENTCAILMEPVQGEGGIIPADKEYLQKVRALCDEKDMLLLFDEVQCGVGRTGELFAYQTYGVEPDAAAFAKGLAGGVPIGAMMAKDSADEVQCGVGRTGELFAYQTYGVEPDAAAFAKGLAGGVPIGAMMAKDSAAIAFKPGDHASTFGGNSLATAAGTVVVNELINNGLIENVKKQGALLTKKLLELKEKYGIIKDVRGIGLMQGIELTIPAGPVIADAIDKGLLLVGAGANVIRFVPALIITSEEIEEAVAILDKALANAVIADAIDKGLLLVGAGANVIRFVPALIITSEEIEEAVAILDKALANANK